VGWLCLVCVCVCGLSQRFNVEGPDTVFAAPGSDIVLPCSIKPTMSAVDMEVKWSRQDLGDILVHHYMNNSDKNDGQMPSYRGRTALFIEQLQYGNTSLLLKNVEVSDGGQYTCRVDSAKWDGQVRVLLKIEAVGRTPEITVLGTASGGVLLQCDSKGWWPVPELQWLDSKGVEVPAGVKESCEDGEGFYVRRRLTNVMEEKIDITDHLPRDYTAAIVVPVVLILLSALVGVMYFTWRGKPVSVTQYIPVPQSSYLVCLCQECLILSSSSPEPNS
uniref:Ig-like domain-containing protein n=1 Tax=Electrophorus electricus TaxID=8005 RepID=A0A4W4DNT0_ELEEL